MDLRKLVLEGELLSERHGVDPGHAAAIQAAGIAESIPFVIDSSGEAQNWFEDFERCVLGRHVSVISVTDKLLYYCARDAMLFGTSVIVADTDLCSPSDVLLCLSRLCEGNTMCPNFRRYFVAQSNPFATSFELETVKLIDLDAPRLVLQVRIEAADGLITARNLAGDDIASVPVTAKVAERMASLNIETGSADETVMTRLKLQLAGDACLDQLRIIAATVCSKEPHLIEFVFSDFDWWDAAYRYDIAQTYLSGFASPAKLNLPATAGSPTHLMPWLL